MWAYDVSPVFMSPRVLYVDDDRTNLIVFEATFGEELQLVTASNGAEALAMLAKYDDIGVLLTDERMPGMTGTQLAERVSKTRPDVIRMLVTAYTDLSTVIDAVNLGHVHQYLRKPWDATEMRTHIRDALDLFSTRRRLGELERRMREVERVYSLGVVAASIVHELRNPMSVIAGYVDLAKTHAERLVEMAGPRGAAAAAELEGALDGAWEATMRMGEISRGVELSTRRQAVTDRTDVGEVVELTLLLVANDLNHRGIAQVTAPRGFVVGMSPTQLGQVVLNLVVNAVQALPDTRAIEDNKIVITVSRVGPSVLLEVADNGAGVPDEQKMRIFDPFFTTKAAGGTGLGLAISKQIVEDAGCRLRVHDTPGGGATFSVELPALAS
jgi:signal transduction histidine kinase